MNLFVRAILISAVFAAASLAQQGDSKANSPWTYDAASKKLTSPAGSSISAGAAVPGGAPAGSVSIGGKYYGDGSGLTGLAGGGDMTAATYIANGAGAPSNPCATAGGQYRNTGTTPYSFWFCPSAGGTWLGPVVLRDANGNVGIGAAVPGGAPAGSVSAVKFYGDGSALTGIVGGGGGGDMTAATYITAGAGIPASPCATAGAQYRNISTTPYTFWFCPSAGGTWLGPVNFGGGSGATFASHAYTYASGTLTVDFSAYTFPTVTASGANPTLAFTAPIGLVSGGTLTLGLCNDGVIRTWTTGTPIALYSPAVASSCTYTLYNWDGAAYQTLGSTETPGILRSSERSAPAAPGAGFTALWEDSVRHTWVSQSNGSANNHIMPRTGGATDQLASTDLSDSAWLGRMSNINTWTANQTFAGIFDAHSAAKTLPHRSGAGSPAGRDACGTIGETYFQTDATAGQNTFGCTAAGTPGTWSLQGGGGGSSGYSTIDSNGAAAAQRPTVNFISGTNATITCVDNSGSTRTDCTVSATAGSSAPVFPINAQTATYQLLPSDFTNFKTIAIASGTFTITAVASGAQPPGGTGVLIINYGPGMVTFARIGQNINGAASNLTIPAGTAAAPTGLWVISDGTNYMAVALGGSNLVSSVAFNGGSPQGGAVNLAGITTPTTTDTLTNKAYDAEGTGNALKQPTRILFYAAGCGNGTATAGLNFGTANMPTAACQGSTGIKGVLQFAHSNVAYIDFSIPEDWNSSSNFDVKFYFTTTDTTNGHTTQFDVKGACNGTNNLSTDDPALNTMADSATATTGASAMAGAEQVAAVTLSAAANHVLNGCSAGNNLQLSIARNASDTNTDTAVALKTVVMIYGRAINATNR
jgi:hypothetical protein